mgnify:CR=1 FL=1
MLFELLPFIYSLSFAVAALLIGLLLKKHFTPKRFYAYEIVFSVTLLLSGILYTDHMNLAEAMVMIFYAVPGVIIILTFIKFIVFQMTDNKITISIILNVLLSLSLCIVRIFILSLEMSE